LVVRGSPTGDEETLIRIDRIAGRVELDRSRSSKSGEGLGGIHGGPFIVAPGEPIELRVLVDRTIIEVFVNESVALTGRIYPVGPDSVGIAAYTEGGSVAPPGCRSRSRR
jgi:Beta-fructosidases (levanase/invertase)